MKRNYEKMCQEYDEKVTSCNYTFDDLGDIVKFAEGSHPQKNGGFIIKTNPRTLVWIAFKIGYVAALRHEKRAKRTTA